MRPHPGKTNTNEKQSQQIIFNLFNALINVTTLRNSDSPGVFEPTPTVQKVNLTPGVQTQRATTEHMH